MEFGYTPEDEAFRSEIRAWLAANKADIDALGALNPHRTPQESVTAMRGWSQMLYRDGWAGISWPVEFGGRGATIRQQMVFNEEVAQTSAPDWFNAAHELVGPLLIAHGTPEQQEHLEPILRGDEVWCQGFSEPGAGSDLASLVTRAEIHGDVFVINGQKTWTSYAPYADMCIVLVRTSKTAGKHKSLSLLLVPLDADGVEIRPITDITGDAHFNEVFFTDVEVPLGALVGEIDQGWHLVMEALGNERGVTSIGHYYRCRRKAQRLIHLAGSYPTESPAVHDQWLRRRLAEILVEVELMGINTKRNISRIINGEAPGPEGAVNKLMWSTIEQGIFDLAMDILGPLGAYTEGAELAIDRGEWSRGFLQSRMTSIVSGTSEIQKNILGERWLGLPKLR